jgi:hypothetical protein
MECENDILYMQSCKKRPVVSYNCVVTCVKMLHNLVDDMDQFLGKWYYNNLLLITCTQLSTSCYNPENVNCHSHENCLESVLISLSTREMI